MASILRGVLLLFLHVCLLTCSVWAEVFVHVPETVEVYKGDTAEIPVQYNFTEKEPTQVIIQVSVPESDRWTLLYKSSIHQDGNKKETVEPNTDYTNRIEVISDGQRGFRFIIKDVQLSDHREFIFYIIGFGAGHSFSRTSLRVFAPPEAPVIEGVRSAIPVSSETLPKVASCEVPNAFPKPSITWYRNAMPLTPEPEYVNVVTRDTQQPSGSYDVHSTLQYKVSKDDNDATFSCEVIFSVPGGTRRLMSNSTNISVLYMWELLSAMSDKITSLEAKLRDAGKRLADSETFQKDAGKRLADSETSQKDAGKRLADGEKKIAALEEKEKTKFFFSASAIEIFGPNNKDTTVIYKNVITNIGGAYNKATGVFTAPVSGVYYFAFFYRTGGDYASYLLLYKNNKMMVMIREHTCSAECLDSGGNAVFLQLQQGDQVKVVLRANTQVHIQEVNIVTRGVKNEQVVMKSRRSSRKRRETEWS